MDDVLRIRLDRADVAALRRAAEAARLSMSAYVRACLFSEQMEQNGFTLRGIDLGAARSAVVDRKGERLTA